MHTTDSGVEVPQGPDAFDPPTQFKNWADKSAEWENRIVVELDSDRLALSSPELRDGLECYVRATKITWLRMGSDWVITGTIEADITTFGTGWSATNSGAHKPRVRRIGKQVLLMGGVTIASGASSTNILTVPAAFQPPTTSARFIGATVASNAQVGELILSNGILSYPPGYGNISLPVGATMPISGMSWWMD